MAVEEVHAIATMEVPVAEALEDMEEDPAEEGAMTTGMMMATKMTQNLFLITVDISKLSHVTLSKITLCNKCRRHSSLVKTWQMASGQEGM